MTDVTSDHEHAARLRDAVVDELVDRGEIVSKDVEAVMRKVARHAFTPEASLEDAYHTYNAVVTKRNEHGRAVSSVSAPQIQAFMLEQAEVRPGMRVLEIGSGGLNAAYLAELVGNTGEVTTVDIDPEVTERAARLLAQAGYPDVRVLLADATEGVAAHAPYDVIMVTVGSWDIPPAWIEQLTATGRLVVPLRIRGLVRSVAFQRQGNRLVSTSARICGFVSMQGAGAHEADLLLVNGTEEIVLRFDDGLPADPGQLNNAVRSPRVEISTGVLVRRMEPVDTLQLYMATVLPGFCTMSVDAGLDTGLVAPRNKGFSMACVEGANFAYITTRIAEDDAFAEFVVHAFGPGGPTLAEAIADHVRTWDREHRGGPGPRITLYPAGTPDDQIPELPGGRVIDKTHCRVTLSWSPTATAAEDRATQHHTTE
ncbi:MULTISPECIES: methyltransferase, FxLD system [Streptomycetaceae]|uniref:Protein-L-isoaspartate O-methyltransferase n=1 Tax=Streptantibioticus cattleyicolor (strain ATCC 35852 / DSM 46488 / JCM 4925 / NBRC 14057 / NRRL 8057) TaxID=1003195 RepID=F8JS00_STREN|nr:MULTISPECIES: methyltransferase, FxLD system [Streptomycetaceae]AEW92911.1 protein-L-isoaspartate(D-aspartate) O-methyltransferase [Streptantibioticus cattleyicolor NRRL 8057 = DSM 46488]MYS57661.1 methyltransferase, FxLD system [Streptomyces sp. SID5468]CCB73268.1 Protein-L-isoaspartate(D-aspartate) O-methyltransferase [Streptantibioticus cattleyicolor NRRL 8057 = DSM 46488]